MTGTGSGDAFVVQLDGDGPRALASIICFEDAPESDAIQANRIAFRAVKVISFISYALIGLALLKAMLFIYARFVFDPRYGDLPVEFLGNRDGPSNIIVTDVTERAASNIGFEVAITENWYCGFGDGLRPNRRGQLRIPRPLSFFFLSLVSRRLMYSFFDGSSGEGTFGGHGPNDRRYMLIDLPPNSRLVVRFRNLLAFSESVRFRTIYDIRLAMLLQHSFALRTVEGPGSVIVCADGGTAAVMGPTGTAVAPFDVVAFDADGSMKLDVQHGFYSVYFDGYSTSDYWHNCNTNNIKRRSRYWTEARR